MAMGGSDMAMGSMAMAGMDDGMPMGMGGMGMGGMGGMGMGGMPMGGMDDGMPMVSGPA